MKHILPLIVILCASCTTRPKVTMVDPVTGATTTYDLGQTFMAKTEGVLASIDVPKGPKMKYSSITEDSSEVPKHLITTGGLVAGGIIANRGEEIREVNSTARHKMDAGVTKHLSDNKFKTDTFVPTVTPPAVLAR